MATWQSARLRLGEGPERAFHHRGTPADLGVIEQMFSQQDYSLDRLRRAPELQALYEALAAGAGRPLIIDAGANIGASAVYFGCTFPAAHIVAIEPARSNFELLQANTQGLDVDARHAAIGAVAG